MPGLRVLCVHGVGHHEQDPNWRSAWERAIQPEVERAAPGTTVVFGDVPYDELFAARPLRPQDYAEALWRLTTSWIYHGTLDLFRTRRGLLDVPDLIRWTAGMVVQWASDEVLRRELRERVYATVESFRPDVILAHSLGSLLCHDAFTEQDRGPQSVRGRTLVTFGSQIGHPAVRAAYGGRIQALPEARAWYHLFNPLDRVFTSQIVLTAPNFRQLLTHFDSPDMANHALEGYLQHPDARISLWPAVTNAPMPRAALLPMRRFQERARPPESRALLVGINEYPRPEMRLAGCVNDVFSMSAALQECGFEAEEIRTVLDERATASAIRERLNWLLADTRPGDRRVFYFSGHGAQLPAYGARDEVDHINECLVPHDFDWSLERAFTDDEFFELYSQLPYDSLFVTVLDCCHSGGMTRAGRVVRGVDPPDDIRHRMLTWDAGRQMWRERKMPVVNRSLARMRGGSAYLGRSGAKRRLGRAAPLRALETEEYDAVRLEKDHEGPYLPILLEACQETEFAYEYRHGVTSYGAFTYLLTNLLGRSRREDGRNPTFQELVALVNRELRALGFEQTASLLGPRGWIDSEVPWSRTEGGTGNRRA